MVFEQKLHIIDPDIGLVRMFSEEPLIEEICAHKARTGHNNWEMVE